MNLQGKFVLTGHHIGQKIPNLTLGEGIYENNGNIFAQICGKINIESQSEKEGDVYHTISIISNLSNKAPCLKLGQQVVGKVVRLKEDMCTLKIMMIDDQPIQAYLEGVIRKQNIRESEIDKVSIEQCYIPGDIVRAKIISLGDSQKVFLSTIGDDLGVLFAKDQETNQLMMPYKWNQMISLETGIQEYRKVAKPNLDLFQGIEE